MAELDAMEQAGYKVRPAVRYGRCVELAGLSQRTYGRTRLCSYLDSRASGVQGAAVVFLSRASGVQGTT